MKILYVEDELAHVELTQRTLEDNLQDRFVLYHVDSLRGALKMLDMEPDIDLVLTDLRLPDGSGLDLLERVKERQHAPAIVLVTGQGDELVAVTALKAGAADYLVKEGDYLHRLPAAITNAVAQNRLAREQAALRAVEHRFRVLVEQIPAAVYTDNDDEFSSALYISPQIVDIIGFTAEEWLANPRFWIDRIHPADVQAVLEKIKETHASLADFTLDYRLIHRNGNIVWVRDFARIIRDEEGHPRYWQGILFDITREVESQAAIQAERDFALQVLNNMGQGLTVVNQEGRFEYVNPAYANMLGVQPDELLGRSPEDFTIAEKLETLADERRRRQTGVTSTYESRLTHKEGHAVPVIITGVPRRQNDAITGTIAVITDLTTQKQTEQALERQVRELTVLHAVATAEAESTNEDEIISSVTTIVHQIYSEVCGILLLDPSGRFLTPHPSYVGADISNWQSGYPLTEGLTGRSAMSGKIIRTGNVRNEPEYIEIASFTRSELCVPISMHGRIIGVINVESRIENKFTEHDESFLATIASGLGTALERLRLFSEEQRRARELDILYKTTRTMAQSLDPAVIGQNLVDAMEALLTFDFGGILLFEDATGLIKPLALSHSHPARDVEEQSTVNIPRQGVQTQLSIVDWVMQHGIPVRSGDISQDERYHALRPGIHSELCVPLITRDKVIGVINIESSQLHAFSEKDETLLVALATSAGIALENARLFETELNRRAEAERLREATAALGVSLEIQPLLSTILDAIKKLVLFDSASVFLRTSGDEMSIAALKGFPHPETLLGRRISQTAKWHRLAMEKKTMILVDAQADPLFEKWEESGDIHGWLGVPMIAHDEVIGFINLDSHSVNAFTERDATLAQTFANSAAVAIENAQRFQVEQKRRQEAEVLREATLTITYANTPAAIYEIILTTLTRIIPHDSSSIEIIEGDSLMITASRGLPNPEHFKNFRYPYSPEKWGDLITSRNPIIIPNVQIDDRFEKFSETSYIRSWMGIPLFSKDNLIGFINLDSQAEDFFTAEDAALVQTFGNQAATAIENARLYEAENRRTQLVEAMADIANKIATTREIVPVLDEITKSTLELLRANNAAIYILQDDQVTLKPVSAMGTQSRQLLQSPIRIGEGITGSVVANGMAEIIHNMANDSRRKFVPGTDADDSEYETLISSPLILRGRSIGAINAWRRRSDGLFNQIELNFLIGIAHQVSIAIESARLFQETIRRGQEAAAIAEVGRDISSTLQLDTVLLRIAEYARDLLNAETSAVYIAEETQPILRAIASVGVDAQQVKNDPLEMGTGILGGIAQKKIGEIVNFTVNDPRMINIRDTNVNPVEHLMGVPVLSKNKLTGLVVVWRSGMDMQFLPGDLEFLNSLAQQAATAIENARLYNESQLRLNDLEVVNQISTMLRSAPSLEQMLPAFLDETLRLLQSSDGSLWLYDASRGELIQRTARGLPTQFGVKALKPDEGIIGHVFTKGTAYVSEEFIKDPLLYEGNRAQTPPGLGGICVPIQSTAGTVGVIMIELDSKRLLNSQTGLLVTLSEIAGNAIYRAELFEQGQEQIRRLTALRDIDSAIASSTDLRVTLKILMDHTLKHLKADAIDILLYHPELQSLTYLTSAGFINPSPSRPLMRLGEGLAGQVVMKGGSEYIPNLQGNPEVKRDPILLREGFVSYFGIPLVVKGQIKGVFEIFHRSPFTATEDWVQFLQTLSGQAAIAIDNSQLYDNLQRSNQEIRQAYDTTLEGWARALELRDRETEGHTRRVTELTMQMARYMGFPEDELVNMYRGVLLHDIGKMGVPDQILRKTGPLNETEWYEMRKHPEYAFNLLAPIPYLRPALDIPYCHHEHWDGSGYPRGLRGEQIPLAARIFSIVDIWDALLSDRPYRKAWPREKVIEYLKEISGKILDPNVVREFLRMLEEQS